METDSETATTRSSARTYLADRQRMEADGHSGRAYDEAIEARYVENLAKCDGPTRARLDQNLRARRAYHAKYEQFVPTPYQSIQDFARLHEAKVDIDGILTQENGSQFRPVSNLLLGSVESKELNAESLFFPDSDENLIIFNRGLLQALLRVCNLLATAAVIKPEGIEFDDGIVQRFAPIYGQLLRTVLDGSVPSPDSLVTLWRDAPTKEALWTMLEDAGTECVFGHEYAHILLGHVKSPAVASNLASWGDEYEADSIALDLVAQAWVQRLGGDTGASIIVVEGMTAFFRFLSHLEQYGAQCCGDPAFLWDRSQSHPPTRLRWGRMLDKARARLSEIDPAWARLCSAQSEAVASCLDRCFLLAVGTQVTEGPVTVAWHYQDSALATMLGCHLVPQHLFLALRCARATLLSGAPLDQAAIRKELEAGDDKLRTAGARPLLDYRDPLSEVILNMSQRTLRDAERIGKADCERMVDQLSECVLLDARCRYPAV